MSVLGTTVHATEDATYRSPPLRALDYEFAVATNDAALGRHLERLLGHFRVEEPGACTHYAVVDAGEEQSPRYRLYRGGELFRANHKPRLLLASLLWHLNQEVVRTARRSLLFHAAAASRNGAGLLLPAPMESGKTTLVSALLRRGFRYLTDEAVSVDLASNLIRPFPKALSLDHGSWHLFPDLAPPDFHEMREWTGGQWQVDPGRFGPDAVSGEVPAAFVVFPRYVAGASTRLEPVRRSEALVELAANSFNLASLARCGFDAAGRLVAGTSGCYRLQVGRLEEACEVLVRLVDEKA